MEINNTGTMSAFLSMLYRSKNPTKELDTPGFSWHKIDYLFIKKRIIQSVRQPEKGLKNKDHPQWQLLLDMERFAGDATIREEIYYKTMSTYFLLNLTVFCSINIFCFVDAQPIEYVCFELRENSRQSPITLTSNTISNHRGVPIRVMLKKHQRYAFDLDNGVKSQTARGGFMCISLKRCLLKTPTTEHHCMVILKKGKQTRVFYNHPRHKVAHEMCFLEFR